MFYNTQYIILQPQKTEKVLMMTFKQIDTGAVADKNSVFIAFYTDPYHHYQTNEDCKSWGEHAWFSKVSLLGIIMRWDASYGFVGGQVDEGENLLEAAIRECKEEVGLSVKAEQLTLFCSHEMPEQHTHLFICKVTPEEIYNIQKESVGSYHGRVESSGFNVVHMVENSFENLLNSVWAGTSKEEFELLVKSNIIQKPSFEKNI